MHSRDALRGKPFPILDIGHNTKIEGRHPCMTTRDGAAGRGMDQISLFHDDDDDGTDLPQSLEVLCASTALGLHGVW